MNSDAGVSSSGKPENVQRKNRRFPRLAEVPPEVHKPPVKSSKPSTSQKSDPVEPAAPAKLSDKEFITKHGDKIQFVIDGKKVEIFPRRRGQRIVVSVIAPLALQVKTGSGTFEKINVREPREDGQDPLVILNVDDTTPIKIGSAKISVNAEHGRRVRVLFEKAPESSELIKGEDRGYYASKQVRLSAKTKLRIAKDLRSDDDAIFLSMQANESSRSEALLTVDYPSDKAIKLNGKDAVSMDTRDARRKVEVPVNHDDQVSIGPVHLEIKTKGFRLKDGQLGFKIKSPDGFKFKFFNRLKPSTASRRRAA